MSILKIEIDIIVDKVCLMLFEIEIEIDIRINFNVMLYQSHHMSHLTNDHS
jgi:hypothetical protein